MKMTKREIKKKEILYKDVLSNLKDVEFDKENINGEKVKQILNKRFDEVERRIDDIESSLDFLKYRWNYAFGSARTRREMEERNSYPKESFYYKGERYDFWINLSCSCRYNYVYRHFYYNDEETTFTKIKNIRKKIDDMKTQLNDFGYDFVAEKMKEETVCTD